MRFWPSLRSVVGAPAYMLPLHSAALEQAILQAPGGSAPGDERRAIRDSQPQHSGPNGTEVSEHSRWSVQIQCPRSNCHRAVSGRQLRDGAPPFRLGPRSEYQVQSSQDQRVTRDRVRSDSKMKPLDVMWVGLGGGLGSALRWWVGRVVGERYHGDFPLGTFLINILGTFLIGYLSVLFGVDWHDRHGHGMVLNAFVLTGVLGGYTTFSSMQLDAVKLSDKRRGGIATSYLLLSVAAGLLTGQIG